MTQVPFVSVVVPAYNSLPGLAESLSGLLRQDYPLDRYEIVVVDDGSTDRTKEVVEGLRQARLPAVRYFFQANKGPAAARNLGVGQAQGGIIAFIDSDCLPERDWLRQIVKGYAHPLIAGIGGRIKALPGDSLVSSYCAFAALNEDPAIDRTGVVYVITGNASFRRDVLMQVGGFDERYDFAGGEDPDICYRIRQAGYAFNHNRRAVVHNRHKNTLAALLKTYYRYGKGWTYLLLRKNSSWDLSDKGTAGVLNLSAAMARLFLMAAKNVQFLLRFLKIPLKTALFYGDGLGLRRSIAYAFFDFCRDIAFNQGCLAGYITGKKKGLKRTVYKGASR